MKINEYIGKIKKLGACGEALKDALNYETSQELWSNCKRGDWMLWLIGKLSGDSEGDSRKKLVLTACKCARLALPYVKKGELRPLKAIETAEKWAKGEANIEEVIIAADAAAAAAYAAAYAAAAYAAAAADAAAAAAYAAADAADAAYAAADAAAYADAADAKGKMLAKTANIVRDDYPTIDSLWEK